MTARFKRREHQRWPNPGRAGAFVAMLTAGALAWVYGQTAVAQTTAGNAGVPAGWHHSVSNGAETYVKGERSDAVVMAKELPATKTQDVIAVTDRLFPLLGCHDTPPSSSNGFIGPFGSRPRCFASFAPSAGGYTIAVGAAVTPAAEAEGVSLARQLSGAAETSGAAQPSADAPHPAPASMPAYAPADVRATDAALAAALDAVPERNLPIHMVLRQGFTYNGAGLAMHNTLWMLFANGVATTCTEWDPGKQAPTAEALAPVEEKNHCSTTRWRRVAKSAVLDDGSSDPVALEDIPPPARGTRYDGHFTSSSVLFSSLSQWGVPGNLVIDSSAMTLSRDGQLSFGQQRSNQTNGDSTTTRLGAALDGRYMIDRYLIAVAANGRVERHFFFALSKPAEQDILFYFDGNLLRSRK